MKSTIIILGICSMFIAVRAGQLGYIPPASPPPKTPLDLQKDALAFEMPYFKPAFPWRIVNSKTSYAKGPGWVQFVGKVIEVHPKKGIRVEGWYGTPMVWPANQMEQSYEVRSQFPGAPSAYLPGGKEFFVTNFPFTVVADDYITWSQKLVAFEAGTYQYDTLVGSTRSLRMLDFGIVTTAPASPPLTKEQKQAADAAAAVAAIAQQKRTLEWHKRLAEEGDPYGLLRMGERYTKGDGVEFDFEKGKTLIARAAAAGSADAKAWLEKASQAMTNSQSH